MSSMSVKRSLKMNQVSMRVMNMDINAVGSTVSGFDASQVKQLVKNGAGDWTIILKFPFEEGNSTKARIMGLVPNVAGVTYHLVASDFDRVNVVLSADVDFNISILGCDHRFNY